VLAIDQGTTGTKALLLDGQLRVVAEASREFPQHFPQPGWVEHSPEEIYASVRQAVKAALTRGRVRATRIAAIGITNQRETTILWDGQTGKPAYPAIVWQDRRTAADCVRLKKNGHEAIFRRKTGLLLDPYFSGTKIAWILRHVQGARKKAQAGKLRFGTIDTYLTWRLSGGRSHVTDLSNASRTLLLDLKKREWSPELCRLLRVPPVILPEIVANDGIFGTTAGVGFLPDGIPITSLIGDQQAALFGQTCFNAGDAKCTYGTGAFLVVNTGPRCIRSRHGLLSTVAWKLGDQTSYALEGSSFIAGAVVQWLRDGLDFGGSAREIEALARSVDDAGGVTLVPALSGLGAPYWEPEARGLICGLTRGTTRAHIARAALEGIAFQIYDLARAMELDIGKPIRNFKVDGGATENDLLLQFQADLLRRRVVRPQITSTTALGTALLAGLNVGLFRSQAALRKVWREDRDFRARMRPSETTRRLAAWKEAIARTRLGLS